MRSNRLLSISLNESHVVAPSLVLPGDKSSGRRCTVSAAAAGAIVVDVVVVSVFFACFFFDLCFFLRTLQLYKKANGST